MPGTNERQLAVTRDQLLSEEDMNCVNTSGVQMDSELTLPYPRASM